METQEVRKQVDEFVELPRSERQKKYFDLPKAVQLRARKAIEKRRGIARREAGGVMVLEKDTYISKLIHLQNKKDVLFPERIKACGHKMVELKKQLQENYGDEALEEAENALEDAAAVEANDTE